MLVQALRSNTAILIYLVSSFLLRLFAGLLNDPNVTPDKKDYIYDMKETGLLIVALTVFIYALRDRSKNWNILLARIVLLSTLYATAKEVAGFNLTSSTTGLVLFTLMILSIVIYSLFTWEKKKPTK